MPAPDDALWRMRHLIYRSFAETGRPPRTSALAAEMGISEADALSLLHELEDRHAVFLTEDRRGVLMANPFSAIPTPFTVTANGVGYWANCTSDMLGVPVPLGADATIQLFRSEEELQSWAAHRPRGWRLVDDRGNVGTLARLVPRPP